MNTLLAGAEHLISSFPWGPEAAWVAIGAFVSACAAIATVLLALYTRNMAAATRELALETTQLARDTVDASDRADEHHQQTLWPFVAITEIERHPNTYIVRLKNIGTGVAVGGKLDVVMGHRNLETVEPLGEYGPIGIHGQNTVTLTNLALLKDSAGKFPDWIVFRVTFESIFHSTGYIDWMFRPALGTLTSGAYSSPPINKRGARPSTRESDF